MVKIGKSHKGVIPDAFDELHIVDVKDRKYVGMDERMMSLVDLSRSMQKRVQLITHKDADLSQEIKDCIKKGRIKLMYIEDVLNKCPAFVSPVWSSNRIVVEVYSSRNLLNPDLESFLFELWSQNKAPVFSLYSHLEHQMRETYQAQEIKDLLDFLSRYEGGILAPEKCGNIHSCKWNYPMEVDDSEIAAFIGNNSGWPCYMKRLKGVKYTLAIRNERFIYTRNEEDDILNPRFGFANYDWVLPVDEEDDINKKQDYFLSKLYPTNLTIYFEYTDNLSSDFYVCFFKELSKAFPVDWGYIEDERNGECLYIHDEKKYNQYMNLFHSC